MPLRIALYDLDNTLYPFTSGVMDLINERINMFVQQRLLLDLDAAMELRHTYFETYGTTLAGLQKHHAVIETEDYLTFVHDITLDALSDDTALLDAALRELPLQKVIFTNSPQEHASRVLQRLRLSDHFSHLLDIRAFEFAAKPHPLAYQTALRALGVAPEECVLFEDTIANLGPAKALGMTTVLIAPPSITQHPHADIVAEDVLTATRQVHAMLLKCVV